MLTTIIYRSHICDNVSIKSLESMVAEANVKNSQEDVSGILLFNGTHFFQLLEGPEEKVEEIYRHICADPRHHNLVELLRDHGPTVVLAKSVWNSLIYEILTAMKCCRSCWIKGPQNISSSMTTERSIFSVPSSKPRKRKTITKFLRLKAGSL